MANQMPVDVRGADLSIFGIASCTRFSPKMRRPSLIASRTRSTETVFVTATSATALGSQLARSALAAIAWRTASRLAWSDAGIRSGCDHDRKEAAGATAAMRKPPIFLPGAPAR